MLVVVQNPEVYVVAVSAWDISLEDKLCCCMSNPEVYVFAVSAWDVGLRDFRGFGDRSYGMFDVWMKCVYIG